MPGGRCRVPKSIQTSCLKERSDLLSEFNLCVVGARWPLQGRCSSWGCYFVVHCAVFPCLFPEECLMVGR